MTEFFRGWKRKVGVVTLLTAFVFLGGWGRSQISKTRISWPIGDNIDYAIDMNVDGLSLGKHQPLGIDLGNLVYSIDFESVLVPYWFVIAPLTLISFWLLLSKPRKSLQKKTTEPAPAEAT